MARKQMCVTLTLNFTALYAPGEGGGLYVHMNINHSPRQPIDSRLNSFVIVVI